jgi:UDP-N-acetylmuramate dehydrogenase
MEILDNFNLKNFNTFHVSAYARYFINVTDITSLKEALAFAAEKELPFMLIGQGSNLLFRENYPGVILEMNIQGKKIIDEDGDNVLVKARCGENWHAFVQWCLGNTCYGLENLSLIPGNIGAAPVQNIGAYGVELCEVMESLEAVEISTGQLKTFSNADCRFSYRSSVFKEELRDQYVIYSVSFRLSRKAEVKVDYASLANALEELSAEEVTPELVSKVVCDIRRSKLPNPGRLGNAGSFFWNPVISTEDFSRLQKNFPDIVSYPQGDKVKLAAAWLIEQAGWKGFREGDVGVHQDHALVLVNYGQGTGAQLVTLSEQIRDSVQDKFGVALTPEVRII